MRIALVHSYYSADQPSGENIVVDAQYEALRRAGHEVLVVGRWSDREIGDSRAKKLSVAISVARGKGQNPTAELEAFRPDIVHVHNLFPNWGHQWLAEWKTPIVATLHNFRVVCAAGSLFRDGAECRQCVDCGSHRAVRNSCYRDSPIASIPLAIATRGGAPKNELVRRADLLISLSSRSNQIHESIGVPQAKLRIVPNFVADLAEHSERGKRWLYIGRLSAEKGLLELAESWPADVGLDVVGSGPLAEELKRISPKSISFHGVVSQNQIPYLLAGAAGLIFPSRWAEGSPLSYIEALASARPVISWLGNGASDDIAESGTGIVLSSWDQLGEAIDRIEAEWPVFSAAARARYESHFSEEQWVRAIENIYLEALAG